VDGRLDHFHEDFRADAGKNRQFCCPIPYGAAKPTPMNASTRDIPTKMSDIESVGNFQVCA
jgi:hypothetical protein